MADLEALMRSAQAALTAAAETVPSAEERRAEAAAAEALAASGAGDVARRVSVIFSDIFHVSRLYQCNSHVS